MGSSEQIPRPEFPHTSKFSENLQLDRLLPATAKQDATVELSSLKGITIAEMDWAELTKGIDPQLDPAASLIPADQHALFFPSFPAVVAMIDEATADGTPVLRLLQPRSEDARSRERYERQLCLSLDAAARYLGQQVIASVAVTGSDPYFRTGTDVAVLFEARNRELLTTFVAARQLAAMKADAGCQRVSGKTGDVRYAGVISPDRTVSSYEASARAIISVTTPEISAGSSKPPYLSEMPKHTRPASHRRSYPF